MTDKICLLITTFNRGHLLKNSLERLRLLTLPTEVLVIDDGSSDNTQEICNLFIDTLPIKYIYNNNKNWSICSFARNIGVKNTDCEFILTSEPEILFCTDVIEQMLQCYKETPDKIISAGTLYHGGEDSRIDNDTIQDPLEWLKTQKVNISTNNPTPKDSKGFAKIQNWQATYTTLYRKSWIEDVGYFDEEFPDVYGGDDIDLCTRIRIKLGINQNINKDIQVIHQYHTRPIEIIGQATLRNMKYFEDKNLSVNGYEDPNNPNLIANKGREVGVIKTR